jgi:hypothetical protein
MVTVAAVGAQWPIPRESQGCPSVTHARPLGQSASTRQSRRQTESPRVMPPPPPLP